MSIYDHPRNRLCDAIQQALDNGLTLDDIIAEARYIAENPEPDTGLPPDIARDCVHE